MEATPEIKQEVENQPVENKETVNEPVVEEVTKEEVDADKKEEIVAVTTSEETANTEEQKEKEPDYQRVGFATHTPCGDGVISQVLDDGRAVVILLASEEKVDVTRIATGIFALDALSKPTYEKEPSSISILRGQVYRDFGDALLGGGIYDKALYLYQNAVNLVTEVDEDYRIDSLVIIITCLCNMCTCFLSLGDITSAERMAKQAYELSPTFDKCAISMATVLVAQNKLEEAIKSIQPALKEKPDSQALIAIHNKIVELIQDEEKKKAAQRAQSSVLMNNILHKSPAAASTTPAAPAAPRGPLAAMASAAKAPSSMNPQDIGQSVLAQMKNEAASTQQPVMPQTEKEESTTSTSSLIWGAVGGAVLLGLFLFKRLHK